MANQITILEQIKALIKGVKTELDGAANSIVTISKNAREAKSALTFNSPKAVNVELQKTAEATTYLNETLKQQAKLEKDLVVALAKKEAALSTTAKQVAKQRYETQQLNKINKEEAVLNSRLSTFYQKQNVILNRLTRRRQDLLLRQKLNNDLTKKEIAELKRLTAAQGKLDRAFKSTDNQVGRNFRGVGKYTNALKGLKNVAIGLVGALGVVEGLRQTFNFTKEAIALAREAKGVEFAFERLGSAGVDAFDRVKKSTRGLIADLDIKTALVDFNNFNISLEQSDVLFEFLAVRAAQTGKSIDKLKDSLVEGLSKESKLRIDNLGIATADLNAELKKAPDFLTAVANIAKREVAEAGDILDKTANGGERLTASFKNAKLAFGQLFEGGSSGILKSFAKQIDRIAFGFKKLKIAFATASKGIKDFIRPIVDLIKRVPILNTIFTKTTGFISKFIEVFTTPGITIFADALTRVGASLSGLGAAFTETKKQITGFVESLSLFSEVQFNILQPNEMRKSLSKVLIQLKNQVAEGGGDIAEAYREAYLNALKPIAKEIKETIDIKPKNPDDGAKKALEGSIKALEDTISKLEKLRSTTARTEEEYAKFTEQIDNSKAALVRLRDELEGVENAITSSLSAEAFTFVDENGDFALGNIFEIAPDDYIDAEKEAQLERLRVEKELNEQLLEQRINFYDSLTDLASESIGALLQMEVDNYDNLIQENDDYYSSLLENEDLSEKQKDALQEERDAKNKILQEKKEAAEKRAFLLGQAKALADVVINTARSVALIKANALVIESNPLLPPGVGAVLAGKLLAQIPFVIGSGAAAGAAIAATTLPEFKDGYLEGDYAGKAKINDEKGSSYKEIVERKSGRLEMFNQRNKVITMQKGDKVHKAGTFNGQDITRQVTMMNMIAQGQMVNDAMVNSTINIDINEKISKEIKKGFAGLAPHKNEPINHRKLAKAMAMQTRANKA